MPAGDFTGLASSCRVDCTVRRSLPALQLSIQVVIPGQTPIRGKETAARSGEENVVHTLQERKWYRRRSAAAATSSPFDVSSTGARLCRLESTTSPMRSASWVRVRLMAQSTVGDGNAEWRCAGADVEIDEVLPTCGCFVAAIGSLMRLAQGVIRAGELGRP